MGWASAAMSGCLHRPKHTSGEDGTWSHATYQDQSNDSKKQRGTPSFDARALAMQHACPQGVSSDELMLARANHASGEDGTWSHGSVAERPTKWLRETPALHFSARTCYAQHMSPISAGRLQQCEDTCQCQTTDWARMGLGLLDQSHQDPSNGSKKPWGSLHFST
jgi:hypothetical protein